MALWLPQHWVWDFWFARDGDELHVFYLKAPRSLGDPELRHWHARLGHSVSCDARTWHHRPDPLPPAPNAAADDMATWTGCVIELPDGGWRMYYTGISTRENGAVQRILSATSQDLTHWERDEFAMSAPDIYERLHPGVTQEQWRDPWVSFDPNDELWHMLITARRPSGELDGRGAIAHATSPDLASWTVHPPITPPGLFSQIEVPQHLRTPDGTFLILFSALPDDTSYRLLSHGARRQGGTHLFRSSLPWTDFDLVSGPFLDGGTDPALYACKVLHLEGRPHLMGWHRYDPAGDFGGGLSDPRPLNANILGPRPGSDPETVHNSY